MTEMYSGGSAGKQEAAIDVLCVGHALVDVLASADDGLLAREGLVKGSMHLIDAQRAATLYDHMGPASEASGGSAANTATGVVACGGTAAFIGTVADDQLGEIFDHDIRAAGVIYRTPRLKGGPATGRSMILVSPDGERTMNTYLGAGASVGVDELDPELIGAAQITYLEGYMLDTPHAGAALHRTVELVRSAGRKLSITLSDLFCVDRHYDTFLGLLDEVDICFGNVDEACALMGTSDADKAIDEMAKRCEVVAITAGAEGSIVASGTARYQIPVVPTTVVDTTGAGDLYASGVLTGLAQGRDLETCGRMGSAAASSIISQFGARLAHDVRL